MQVIHFTAGATDPLVEFGARAARFVPLADGQGDIHLSCLHLARDSQIAEPPVTHDCVLLVVHGDATYRGAQGLRLDLEAGVGLVLKAGETYTLASRRGAIVIAIESRELKAHARGLSTPGRIVGQRWPGETLGSESSP